MIGVKNIYKNFGKLEVLKGVSCEIKQGEKVVIIGPSGSGKSTLLRCMNLLETPTYGEIWLEDKLLTPIDPYLHFDVIRLSKTYRLLLEELKTLCPDASEEELVKLLVAQNLLTALMVLLQLNHVGLHLTNLKLDVSQSTDASKEAEKFGLMFSLINQ